MCGLAQAGSGLAPAQTFIEVCGTTLLRGPAGWGSCGSIWCQGSSSGVSRLPSGAQRPRAGFAGASWLRLVSQEMDLDRQAEQILADDLADDERAEEWEIACALPMLVCPKFETSPWECRALSGFCQRGDRGTFDSMREGSCCCPGGPSVESEVYGTLAVWPA